MGDPRFPDLTWWTVKEQLTARMGARYPLSGETRPEVYYNVEHDGGGISLYVGLDRTEQPPRSPLAAVRVDSVSVEGRRMARFSTTRSELLRDFHDLLMAIAERIVVKDHSLDRAFGSTILAWNALLNRPRSLSARQRLGLHGELAVLQRLAEHEGWPAAVAAWVGHHGEEHDFALDDCDLEVKTTAAERRCHTIHGLGQLQETPDRRLWFVSLQLTRGGRGGRTLQDSVEAVNESVAATDLDAARQFESALVTLGWNPDQPDDERWALRSEPLVLSAASMPRLTPDMVPAAASSRIADVTYDVDVTGSAHATDGPIDLSALRLP